PEAPEVKVQDDGSVTITPKKGSDTKTVTVTYKNQDGEDKTATATKGDNGEWTVTGDNGETIDKTSGVITIPIGKSNPGDKVVAKAKDPSENESGPSDDTTMPAPPTITPDQTSGNVTITPPTKGNLDGMDIEYKTPEGTDRKVRVVKGTDKKWKIEGENPDEVTVTENQGIVTIPKGKAKEKTEVIAKSTLGEKKAPAQKTPDNQHLVPDKTGPQAPIVKVNEKNGEVTITPPTDEDLEKVEVDYSNPNGTSKKATATKDEQGKWTVVGEEGVEVKENGVITIPYEKVKKASDISAKAYDKYGNDSKPNTDTQLPPPPTVTPNKDTGVITVAPPTEPAVDGFEITYTPAKPTEQKTIKVKKGNNSKWIIEGDTPEGVTIGENGLVTFAKGSAKENSKVSAFSKIGELKGLDKPEGSVPDKTAPEAPEVKVQD
ncbi:hypothetical protein, partial [Anaerococcus tetradius]